MTPKLIIKLVCFTILPPMWVVYWCVGYAACYVAHALHIAAIALYNGLLLFPIELTSKLFAQCSHHEAATMAYATIPRFDDFTPTSMWIVILGLATYAALVLKSIYVDDNF